MRNKANAINTIPPTEDYPLKEIAVNGNTITTKKLKDVFKYFNIWKIYQ